MPTHYRTSPLFRPGISFILLIILLCAVWLAGGASRADVLGQPIVRATAWAVLLVLIAAGGGRPAFGHSRPVLLFLIAAAALPLLQLAPLPPDVWQALPGRAMLREAAAASGEAQPWRPWSIVPGATMNAAASLVVPLSVLVLVASLNDRERLWLPGLLLSLITAAALVGLLQFSGAGFNNLFVNDKPGEVSGTFANRNHLALLLAFGCMLAPVWAFLEGRQPQWRGPIALGLALLFALTILACGSRVGLVLGGLGLGIGLLMVRQGIKKALSRYPRWVFPALVAGIIVMTGIFVLISVAADRAQSIERALELDVAQDLRARALPTVVDLIQTYFPAGSGLGSFDPMFRIYEPYELLAPVYFNHAHNDFLEIALDAGLPGVLLLLVAMFWWAWASVQAWMAGSSTRHALPKLGSAMLLLVFIASIFDYPARTPLIMAMIIVAGVWLGGRVKGRVGSALPKSGQPL